MKEKKPKPKSKHKGGRKKERPLPHADKTPPVTYEQIKKYQKSYGMLND